MKYLIVLLVVALMIWMARAGKRAEKVKAEKAARKPAITQDLMVECAQCGVHLPNADAVRWRDRAFCSEAHRAAYEHSTASR